MKVIEITGKVKGEIVISSRRESGNVVEGEKWISGTVLRGALASWWRRRNHPDNNPGKETLFRDLFLSEKVRFGPLFPVAEYNEKYEYIDEDDEEDDGKEKNGFLTLPIPLSAKTCKIYPGFLKKDSTHGITDWLLNYGQGNFDGKCEIPRGYNPCGNPLDKCSDSLYYRQNDDSYESYSLKLRMAQHVGMDNWKNVAKKGFLYSLFSIGEGEVFRGYLWGENKKIGEFGEELSTLNKLFIGKGSARNGYLEMRVTNEEKFYPDKFNEKIQGLTITFITPAIIQDEFLRYKSVLTPKDFGIEYIPNRFDSIFSRTQTTGGWQAVHKLPKVKEIAISEGSCFYLSSGKPEDIPGKFKISENWGQVGKRKTEGFGIFKVNDDFHIPGRRN